MKAWDLKMNIKLTPFASRRQFHGGFRGQKHLSGQLGNISVMANNRSNL